MQWQKIAMGVERLPTPEGWLVRDAHHNLIFVPDKHQAWDSLSHYVGLMWLHHPLMSVPSCSGWEFIQEYQAQDVIDLIEGFSQLDVVLIDRRVPSNQKKDIITLCQNRQVPIITYDHNCEKWIQQLNCLMGNEMERETRVELATFSLEG